MIAVGRRTQRPAIGDRAGREEEALFDAEQVDAPSHRGGPYGVDAVGSPGRWCLDEVGERADASDGEVGVDHGAGQAGQPVR